MTLMDSVANLSYEDMLLCAIMAIMVLGLIVSWGIALFAPANFNKKDKQNG